MEPTGPHENVAGKIASKLSIEIDRQGHPWVLPRICLIRPFADIATARRPDVVVLDEPALVNEPLWEREPVIVLNPSVKLVVEVVSTNWETELASATNLVEIDLLRQWEPLLSLPSQVSSDYRILVSPSAVRPRASLYAFNLTDAIPAFPLPLGPVHSRRHPVPGVSRSH